MYGSLSLGKGLKDMKKVLIAVLALVLLEACSKDDEQITVFEGVVELAGENPSFDGLEVGISENFNCVFSCDFKWNMYPLVEDGVFSIRVTTKEAESFNVSVWTVDGRQLLRECDGCSNLEPDKKHSNIVLYAER